MDPAQLNGKTFAVVLIDESGEGTTFYGTARWNGSHLIIDRGNQTPFEVREEWHERIQPVSSPVVKAVFSGAEFWLRLQTSALNDHQS